MLVTDRTFADVERAQKLIAKVQTGQTLTTAERAEYMDGLKGCYNMRTDWNRVEQAVRELSHAAGLTLTTKTAWTYDSISTRAEVQRYLDNVQAIKDAIEPDINPAEYPLPSIRDWITFEGANQIERLLAKAYDVLQPTPVVVFYWDKYTIVTQREIALGNRQTTTSKPPSRALYNGVQAGDGYNPILTDPVQGGKILTAEEQLRVFNDSKAQGKICYYQTDNKVYRYEQLAVGAWFSQYTYTQVYVQDGASAPGGLVGRVQSEDATAYPDNGILDGYWYVKVK